MERCTSNPAFEPSDRGRATQTARGLLPSGERLSFRTADEIPAALPELATQGFTSTEAGNLGAYLPGLARTDDGWTIDEIERLLFVRHLVTRRHISGPDHV
jgi:hypothetical protein